MSDGLQILIVTYPLMLLGIKSHSGAKEKNKDLLPILTWQIVIGNQIQIVKIRLIVRVILCGHQNPVLLKTISQLILKIRGNRIPNALKSKIIQPPLTKSQQQILSQNLLLKNSCLQAFLQI